MSSSLIQSVILAGGIGSRLWPLSRADTPKQFLKLQEEGSMLTQTINRGKLLFESISGSDHNNAKHGFVFTNTEYRFQVGDAVAQSGCGYEIVLEPERRGTAPPIIMSALNCLQNKQDAVLVVMPSDHYVSSHEQFRDCVAEAVSLANKGYIVTLGATAEDKTDNGYGFIVPALELSVGGSKVKAYEIEKFIEKPSRPLLSSLHEQGCIWNCGIFVVKSSTLIEEIRRLRPSWIPLLEQAYREARFEQDFVWLDEEKFSACSGGAFDRIVMEQTDSAAVVRLDGWSDVGSWNRLYHVSEKDENNNSTKGDVILENVKDSFVYNSGGPLVVGNNLKNKAIVSQKDVVFVTDMDELSMHEVLSRLEAESREEAHVSTLVNRPWGFFESLAKGDGFQVKRLGIKPDSAISVQKHFKRSEHWVVLSGTAEVLLGEDWKTVEQGQSIFIPVETIHSVRNTQQEMLYIIEAQLGDYLGEDDIVRYSDMYGRENE